jgi:hypothetical protein
MRLKTHSKNKENIFDTNQLNIKHANIYLHGINTYMYVRVLV